MGRTGDRNDLYAGIARGDRQAQREAVERHLPPLLRLLGGRCGLRSADAEEVALDVLADLLMHPERFDAGRGTPLGGWLARVAVNRVIDRVRREARGPALETDPDVARLAVPEADPSLESAELAELLALASEVLSPAQREMLWWHAFGTPHGTIAEWTGRREAAVRQSVRRARLRLAEAVLARLRTMPGEPRHGGLRRLLVAERLRESSDPEA